MKFQELRDKYKDYDQAIKDYFEDCVSFSFSVRARIEEITEAPKYFEDQIGDTTESRRHVEIWKVDADYKAERAKSPGMP